MVNNKGLKMVAAQGFVAGKVADATKAGAVRFSLNPKGKVKVEDVRKAASKAGLVLVEDGTNLVLCVPRKVA